ncbi:MAG: CopD family protein [Gemmatimonadaceae bacterium]|nr:CopD family protein [Gemmatimonadaceae bacterium]
MEWIIARWVTFVATLLVTGACAVALALAPRFTGDEETRHAMTRDAARLGIGAILALIPASFLRLADQVMALRSPGDPILQGVDVLLMSTTWGSGFLWQSAATLVAGIGCWLAARHPRATPWWLVATAGALGLCATPALQGHAIGSEERTALAVAADVAHVFGGSVWLGALGVIAWLSITLPNADGVRDPDHSARADARLRALVPLVPPLALTGAVLLIVSGVVATVMHLQAVSDLWLVAWGRYVLAKTVLVCVIVALGALNWRRLGPRLALHADVSAMRKSLVTELLLALLVLIITAMLVVTPLPGE